MGAMQRDAIDGVATVNSGMRFNRVDIDRLGDIDITVTIAFIIDPLPLGVDRILADLDDLTIVINGVHIEMQRHDRVATQHGLNPVSYTHLTLPTKA